jgi:hypothetical protein
LPGVDSPKSYADLRVAVAEAIVEGKFNAARSLISLYRDNLDALVGHSYVIPQLQPLRPELERMMKELAEMNESLKLRAFQELALTPGELK